MKGDTIHFKIAHRGVTRRFALPRDSVDLIVDLKKRVKKIVGAEDVELYWRDDDSQIVLEDSEDMFAAVDFAETKNKLGCVSLEIGEMIVKEEGNKPKTVTMEESKSSFNGFAFMCDGCRSYLTPSNGGRFKCIICDNYDLCAACVSKNVHDNHAFVLLRNAETEIPLVNETGAVLSMMVKDAERCTPTFVVKTNEKKKEMKSEKEKEIKTDVQKLEAFQQRHILNIWDDSEDEDEKLFDYLNRQKLSHKNGKLTNNVRSEKEETKAANVAESFSGRKADQSAEPARKETAEMKEATKKEDAVQKSIDNELAKTDEKKIEKPLVPEEKKNAEYSREQMIEMKNETDIPTSSSIPAELNPSVPKKKKESTKNEKLKTQSIFYPVVIRDEEKKVEGKGFGRKAAWEYDFEGEGDWRNGREDRREERSYREYDRGENRHDPKWNYRRDDRDYERERYDDQVYWENHGYDDRRRRYRDDDYDYRNDRYDDREGRRQEDSERRDREYECGRDVRYRGGRREEDRDRRCDEDERREDHRGSGRRDESHDRRREDRNEERDPCCEWHRILKKGIIFGPGHENRELDEFLNRREADSRDRNASSGRREERRYIREAIDQEEEGRRMEELDRLRMEEEDAEANEDGYRRSGRREEANRSNDRPPRVQSQVVRRMTGVDSERSRADRDESNRGREDGHREQQENARRHGNEERNGWENREDERRNRRDERGERRRGWAEEDSDSDNGNGWETPSEDSEQMARQRGERGTDREYLGIPSGYDSNHPDPRTVHPYHRKDAKTKRLEDKKNRAKEIEADYSLASQVPAHLAIAVIRDNDMWKMSIPMMLDRFDEYIKHVHNNTYSLKPHIRIFRDGDDVELIGNIAIDLAKHLRNIRSIIRSTRQGEWERSDCMKALKDRVDQLYDALRQNGADGKKYHEIAEKLRPILLTGKFTSYNGQPYGNWDDEFVGFMVADPLRDFATPPRVPSADPSREGLFAPVPKGCRGAKKTAPTVPQAMPAETNEKLLAELEDTDLFNDYQRMYRVCAVASDLREAIDMMLEGDKGFTTFR